MTRDQLKRKLKHLKQAEMAIRFGHKPMREGMRLVWSDFFTVKPTTAHAPVRYSLEQLVPLDDVQLQNIFADYFCFVYFQYYRENGMAFDMGYGYDPKLLELMGLSPYASGDDIRKRFRELAKKYHPDAGGDNQQFIELMDVYNQLKKA